MVEPLQTRKKAAAWQTGRSRLRNVCTRRFADSPAADGFVDADWPGSREDQVEKDEAIKDRRVPGVVHWKEILRRVCVPVSNRHRARGNECRQPRQQTEH